MGILCHWISPLLAAFEADSLTGWRADIVARHLSGCASCQRTWEAQANLAATLRDAPPAVPMEASADLWARIQPQLEPRSVVRPRPWLMPAASAAACALFGVAVAARTGLLSPKPDSEPVAAPVVARAPAPAPVASPAPTKPTFLPPEEVIKVVEADVRGGNAPDPFAKSVETSPRPLLPVAVNSDLRSEMRRGAVGRGGGNRMTPVTPENYGMRSIVRPSAPPRLSYTKRDKSVDDAPAGLHGDVPRDSVRFVASDLSAEQSSAEREPTEAAAMADYQRSLFR